MRRRDFLGSALLAAGSWCAHALPRRSVPQVLIAGGGFAGACCALQLRRLDPGVAVTLIDPQRRYATGPMSNAVIAGLRNLDSITVTRAGLVRAGIRYLPERLASLDTARRRARLASGAILGYDRIVIAPGIRLLYGTPEGYDEAAALQMPHAWIAGTQTKLLAALLQALPAGGTVGISVPAGLMRCPPGPYERASLIAHWLRAHKPRSKVLIFDANNHFPRQDVFMQAWRELYPGMIEWIAPADGGALTRVDAARGIVHGAQGAQRIDLANIIPPQAPALLALEAGLATGHGWCPVKPQSFESQLAPAVHVIGDACIAGAMPKSGSAARSQAHQCAQAIVAAFDEREPPEPALDSVCYSLLAPEDALAIHGHFTVNDGELRQGPAHGGEEAGGPGPQYAAEATAWYAAARADCFAG